MKNRFAKKYKWIVIVIIVVSICTACGKEKNAQMLVSSVRVGYINGYWNNGIQRSDFQIFSVWDECKEQIDALTKNSTELVKTDVLSTEENTETVEIDEESIAVKWDVDYEVVTDSYVFTEQRNDINIYYPQLHGFADLAKEERINALIEADVKKIIGEENKDGDDTLYCISLNYEIEFLNERIISILYTGMYGYIMPGHGLNGEAIATTIDMEKEKVITVKEVVNDFTELRDMLLADEFEHITKWEGKAGGYRVSRDYRGFEDELEEDLQREQKWYTDGNNFVVIIEGWADYNEYAINNESVKHILDAEFLKKLE